MAPPRAAATDTASVPTQHHGHRPLLAGGAAGFHPAPRAGHFTDPGGHEDPNVAGKYAATIDGRRRRQPRASSHTRRPPIPFTVTGGTRTRTAGKFQRKVTITHEGVAPVSVTIPQGTGSAQRPFANPAGLDPSRRVQEPGGKRPPTSDIHPRLGKGKSLRASSPTFAFCDRHIDVPAIATAVEKLTFADSRLRQTLISSPSRHGVPDQAVTRWTARIWGNASRAPGASAGAQSTAFQGEPAFNILPFFHKSDEIGQI